MSHCEHEGGERVRVCRHLFDDRDLDLFVHFTGTGIDHEFLCQPCVEARGEIVELCRACYGPTDRWEGVIGTPEIAVDASTTHAVHRRIDVAWPTFVDLQPVIGDDRDRWVGVTADAVLHAVDLDAGTTRVIVNPGLELERPMLRLSRDGELAAVVDRNGVRGAVIDLEARQTLLSLERDGYHAEHCVFPIAFFEHGGHTLVVHSPRWNRLDLVDPRSGRVLSERTLGEREIDYFHCGLLVSPDQRLILDNGWVWHPFGCVTTWSLERWIDNPWESEDGPTYGTLCSRAYFWDGPAAWLDDHRIAIYGYGDDEQRLVPAVRIFDATTHAELRWFPGPRGELMFDRWLYATDASEGTSVWDVERGTRLFVEPSLTDARYHPSAKTFVSLRDGTVSVLRGAGAEWNRGRVTALAERIARERAFEDLHVLGDALEAEGCTDTEMIAHCHARTMHADRCWVLDRLSAQ